MFCFSCSLFKVNSILRDIETAKQKRRLLPDTTVWNCFISLAPFKQKTEIVGLRNKMSDAAAW